MGDHVAEQMLAMAEFFRQRNDVKKALKCALGAFKLAVSDQMKLQIVLQTGKLYYHHTLNIDEAQKYFEVSYRELVNRAADTSLRDRRLETLCLLCESLIRLRKTEQVVGTIKAELPEARHNPAVYSRLVFLFTEAAMIERQSELAINMLDQFINSCNDTITRTYALITKILVTAELENRIVPQDVLAAGAAIKAIPDTHPNYNNVQAFFMTTQLVYYMSNGMVKTGKQVLRVLQSMMPKGNPPDGMRWADSSYITAVTCLLTQTMSVQHCSYERAHKYYGYAVKHIHEYNTKVQTSCKPLDACVAVAMRRLQLALEENMAQSNIIAARIDTAMDNIKTMADIVMAHEGTLANEFYPRLHCLLGMVALYLENEDAAELQFKIAADQAEARNDKALSVIVALHRTLLYLSQCRHAEYYDISDRIAVNRTLSCSPSVRATVRFVHAFHAYLNNKMADCKMHASEGLELTKAEDMFRLHTLSILLCTTQNTSLAHLFDTLRPTLDWSTKANDRAMLKWTYHIISENYKTLGQQEEYKEVHPKLAENYAVLDEAKKSGQQHTCVNMLKWTTDNLSEYVPKEIFTSM